MPGRAEMPVRPSQDRSPLNRCMIAAHVWDTIGGQSAGMAGALLTRPGNAALPVSGLPQPDAMAADLPSLATELIRMWRP